MQKMIFRLRKKAFSPIFAATVKMTLLWKNSINFLWIFETNLSLTGAAKVVFGVFSPGRTQCIAPKKLPDKAMSIWNLHKKFQLSSAMGLRDFDLQSQPTLMGGEPINYRAVSHTFKLWHKVTTRGASASSSFASLLKYQRGWLVFHVCMCLTQESGLPYTWARAD